MKLKAFVILSLLAAATACGSLHLPANPGGTPPPAGDPQTTPPAGFIERTLAFRNIPNCVVELTLPAQPPFKAETGLAGYVRWQVRIADPDPGGRRNAHVSMDCVGYEHFEDSFVIPETGNTDVTFGGTEAQGNQPMLRPGPTASVKRRHGRVRANGRVFVDDDGEFNPLGASLFWLVWGEKFDPDRMDANLAVLPDFDYVRIFAEVGGGDPDNADWAKVNWADRTIDPTWPDYVEQLGAAIDHAYDKRGKRVDLTIIAGGTGHVRRAFDGVVAVIPGREEKILAAQIVNEGNLPDAALRDALTRELMAKFPLLQVSAYSTRDVAELRELLRNGIGNSITPHTDRDNSGDGAWRQVRQIYDFKGLPGTCRNDEPPGPQSSVATQEEPIHLAMTRIMSAIMGCGAYTFHAGAGVRGGGKADLVRGRPANFWEDPQFSAQVAALVAVGSLIPPDAANWTAEGSHWAGNPLIADMFLDEKGADHGVISFYASHADSRFIVLPMGVQQFVTIRSKTAATIDVFDPVSAKKLQTFVVDAGGSFTLNGPERGGLSGYVLVGRTAAPLVVPFSLSLVPVFSLR